MVHVGTLQKHEDGKITSVNKDVQILIVNIVTKRIGKSLFYPSH